MKECTIILGMHRSGTSVLSGLISILGEHTGSDLMASTNDNPKGYYENNQVYLLNKKILNDHNTDWHTIGFSYKDIDPLQITRYTSKAEAVLLNEFSYAKKIVIKDPRMCLLFPIWETALNNLSIKINIIFSIRNPLEVAHSLKQRDGFSLAQGVSLWAWYLMIAEQTSRHHQRHEVYYPEDYSPLNTLLEKLAHITQKPLTDSIIQQANRFYSPLLTHHNISWDNLADLPNSLHQLTQLLKKRKLDVKQLEGIWTDLNRWITLLSITPLQKNNQHHQTTIQMLNKQLKEAKHLEAKHLKEIAHNEQQKRTQIAKDNALEKALHQKTSHTLKQTQNQLKVTEQQLNNALQFIDSLADNTNKKKSHLSPKKMQARYAKKWYFPIQLKPLATSKKYLIAQSGFFSSSYYLTKYPDVNLLDIHPLEHFYRYGWREGRNPSPLFHTSAYLHNNPDVSRSGINPLIHYLIYGKAEGRNPLPKNNSTPSQDKLTINDTQKTIHASQQTELYSTDYSINHFTSTPIIKQLSEAKNLNIAPPPSLITPLMTFFAKEKNKVTHTHYPKVSIIMPCWNRERVIRKAIDSVFEQSYSHFELIIIDDGSDDKTVSLITQHYAQQLNDKTLILLTNQHQGVSIARNIGLEKATGQLIAYLDSDNQWQPHYLLLMVSALIQNDEINCLYSALLSHDHNKKTQHILAKPYTRKALLAGNFIDLNAFMHRRHLYTLHQGFNTHLTRLVDWELIIRYTQHNPPAYLPYIGVDYQLDHAQLNNITTTVSLDENRKKIHQLHFFERIRYALEPLKIAYVLWDFPALSQTFVMNELRWLITHGHDVIVYFSIKPDQPATLDFSIRHYHVHSPEQLADYLIEHQRNYCHSHFAYPSVTQLTWPACQITQIPFSFMPHAVDIFHHDNQQRNRIDEVSQDPLCHKLFVHGHYHKTFLEKQGVPTHKIAYNFQAVNVTEFDSSDLPSTSNAPLSQKNCITGIVISRYVEKKGLMSLIEAAALLSDQPIVFKFYGYGPEEAHYQQRIQQLGIKTIHFEGLLQDSQAVKAAYRQSDFLIAPCIEASNGDRDGFPTVILEAFAMNVPVITTNIAAIPDYLSDGVHALIANAAQPEALVHKIKQLINMPAPQRHLLSQRAYQFLQQKIGTARSMRMLTDIWYHRPIDIFMVTYNTADYSHAAETFEIIRRIYQYTTTPFTLTIVDNHSDSDFIQALNEQLSQYNNVRLLLKSHNLMCGPSSNIALHSGHAELAIYLCSNEAFIAKHGWERTLIEAMQRQPNAALGGHKIHTPRYVYGKEYPKQPNFKHYRNQHYAHAHPEKVFTHIQGGCFIIRRSVFIEHGGFNAQLPHGGMDIELSYYYESLGYELIDIPEVASLTVKTRPTLTAIVNEHTVVAHPYTLKTVNKQLDRIHQAQDKRCNCCGWQGKTFNDNVLCPDCGSTPSGRLIYRYIATNHRIYRQQPCLLITQDKGLKKALTPLFTLNSQPTIRSIETSLKRSFQCVIIDQLLSHNDHNTLDIALSLLTQEGLLVLLNDKPIKHHSVTNYHAHSEINAFSWHALALVNP